MFPLKNPWQEWWEGGEEEGEERGEVVRQEEERGGTFRLLDFSWTR